MSCEGALKKAWHELEHLSKTNSLEVKFLNDAYTIDIKKRLIISGSCNIAAKDYASILILHYQIKKFQGIPKPFGEWISFKDIPGGEIYYPAFRKRAIEPILRKYGSNLRGMTLNVGKLGDVCLNEDSVSMRLEVFESIPVLVKIWQGDEDFSSEADIIFDKNITEVFCTEDIAVLAGIVAASI